MIQQWLVGGGIFALISAPVYAVAFREEAPAIMAISTGVVMLIAAGISSL